jgi:flagellar hook-associated protein 3 FlgL
MSDRISSFAGPLTQQYLIQSMQSQLTTLTTEASSGMLKNPAASMGAGAASLYRLHAEAAEQNTLQTATTAAGDRLNAVQDALTSMASAVGSIATATINTASATPEGETAIAEQASSTMSQAMNLLNTQYAGSAVFAGDAGSGLPMVSADAPGGPQDTIGAVLNAAVAAKGGPLSSSDIDNLINGPNGLSSVFSNTNSNPAQNYNGAFYTGSTDGQPTKVPIGLNQTLQYNASANQPAFTDLMKGLAMLSMLSAPSSQLDAGAKSTLLQQAGTVIGNAQGELTSLQGNLGVAQAQLQQVSTTQQSAYSATTQQIATMEQADPAKVATQLSTLQTQLEATYEVTAQISQLSLVHFLPTLTA